MVDKNLDVDDHHFQLEGSTDSNSVQYGVAVMQGRFQFKRVFDAGNISGRRCLAGRRVCQAAQKRANDLSGSTYYEGSNPQLSALSKPSRCREKQVSGSRAVQSSAVQRKYRSEWRLCSTEELTGREQLLRTTQRKYRE